MTTSLAPSKNPFISGSIFHHTLTMAATSALALLAVGLVDALDLFFLSLLGDVEIVAAIGFAWPVVFFTLAVSIGVSASVTALVSRSVGAGKITRAKRYTMNVYCFGFALASVMAAALWLFAPELMSAFGANERSHSIATSYLRIMVFCLPIFSLSMSSGALLRAIGDKKRALWAKMAGAGVNAILDPIFIFALGLGVEGAAWATVLARFTIMSVALHGAWRIHGMVAKFHLKLFLHDLLEIVRIVIPVGLAKAGAPISSAFVMATMARFGSEAVAAIALIERIVPFVFVGIYALPQALGPIIGQNFGAQAFDRIRQTWRVGFILIAAYCFLICGSLFLLQDYVVMLFSAVGQTAVLLGLFCSIFCCAQFGNAAQYVAHSTFNVTGRPMLATLFDLGKDLCGTIPLVYGGALWFGATGVLGAQALSTVLFGALVCGVGYRLTLGPKPETASVEAVPVR